MLIIELLAPLRRGATIEELTRDISDEFGPVADRTIRRDLESLELLGLVERRGPDPSEIRSRHANRWRWIRESIRAAIHRQTSELLAEREHLVA
jgi:DeoR/GlpR family transcriptional regulator of sugar metabolism